MMNTRSDRSLRATQSARRGPIFRPAATTVLFGLAVVAGCDKPTAFGEPDSLIVVSDAEPWAELETETYEALEPTRMTVRDERTFHVTHVATAASELDQLLMWRQVLVFAAPDDPRIDEIAADADRDAPPAPGDVFQAEDVWARGQIATAIVLDPDDPYGSWRAALPEVAELLDRQFREYATSRMWVSGVDTVFARALGERYGVTLRAPRIYHGSIGEDGLVRLRNDRPSPADRIRSILIERREPGTAAAEGESAPEIRLDPDAVFDWREGIDSTAYNVPQSIERVDVEPRQFELDGAPAVQVQGMWQDEGTYPAAGPFIARAVRCPDATWFFDAWLYAPHPEDSKYEFMLQLEEILDSFRCTAG